jgi:hypothetical protein
VTSSENPLHNSQHVYLFATSTAFLLERAGNMINMFAYITLSLVEVLKANSKTSNVNNLMQLRHRQKSDVGRDLIHK